MNIYFLLQSFVLAIPALRKVCCCHQCEGGQESAFHYDNGDLKESDTTIRKRKSKSEAWAAKEKKIKSKNNNNQNNNLSSSSKNTKIMPIQNSSRNDDDNHLREWGHSKNMSNEKSYNHNNNMLEEEETTSNESFSAWGNDGMNNATGHITTGKKYLFYAYIVACIVLI
jgi:hypothetical protein